MHLVTSPLDTPDGPARLHGAVPADPSAVLLLGPGASGSLAAADLAALVAALPGRGVGVVLFEQPWHVAGRRIGPRAPLQDPAFRLARAEVGRRWPGVPLYPGGRSAGARIACRTSEQADAGVVALSFPLHPPGKAAATRVDELAGVRGRVLLVSGDRDPYGHPEEWRAALADVSQAGPRELVLVAGAGHSFRPPQTATIVAAVAAFVGAPV